MNRKIALLVLLLTAIALAGVPEASAWKRDKAAFEANSRVLPSTRYRRDRQCLPDDVRPGCRLRPQGHAGGLCRPCPEACLKVAQVGADSTMRNPQLSAGTIKHHRRCLKEEES